MSQSLPSDGWETITRGDAKITSALSGVPGNPLDTDEAIVEMLALEWSSRVEDLECNVEPEPLERNSRDDVLLRSRASAIADRSPNDTLGFNPPAFSLVGVAPCPGLGALLILSRPASLAANREGGSKLTVRVRDEPVYRGILDVNGELNKPGR